MASYRLSRQTRADLDAIGDYTAEQWGLGQAVLYLEGLRDLMARLASTPRLARSYADIRPGYFGMRYRQHLVFFRLAPHGIDVMRVLHARMDAPRHL